jgi:HD-GYP domain-containing protein (c-di-GMP phosphodiesterase class II)
MENPFGIRSRAVSELAGDAARKMKLPAVDVAKIRLAGLLHDAGTLGATRGISEKHESEMGRNERDEFHAHPARGQELFAALEELSDVGLMVRGHHEAYDGTGFPDGLGGDDIPLGARLLAIADTIEHAASSVSNERDEFAFMVIRRHAGTLLDPRLISYFNMITRVLYFERRASTSTGEVVITPKELITGMILARDIVSATGTLLLQKGNKLDSSGITLIRRMLQAPIGGVWIYVGKEE